MIEEKVLKTNLSTTQVVSTNKCVVAMQLLAGWSVVFIVIFNYHHILSSSLKGGDAVAVEHHPFITTTMRLHRLSEHIQSVLQRLQHPTTNCTEAKLLISQFYPGCGFGCTFHHISHCLLIASSSNRTLVFQNDGAEWNYKGGAGLMDIFQPFSSCKYNQSILSNEPIVDCKGPSSNSNQADRLVHIPDRWNLKVDKEHTFPVVPRELVSELAQLHQNPPAWFFAQIMKFLWKMNAETQKFIDEAEAKIPFDKGPLVGIHVRRTDKILEAKYWELKDYMAPIDEHCPTAPADGGNENIRNNDNNAISSLGTSKPPDVVSLKKELESRELALTDVQLDALDKAKEIDILRETVGRLQHENRLLKYNFTLLERRVRSESRASSHMSLNTNCCGGGGTEGGSLELDAAALEENLVEASDQLASHLYDIVASSPSSGDLSLNTRVPTHLC